jgi:hypothetical protein
VAVAPDLDIELLRERVDAGDADAVQTAGDLVVARIELAAGVQLGEDHLDRGHGLAGGQRLVVHRDAAAVVDDGDRVVGVDGAVDARRVAGEGLVDRVVDDLIDQMMQAHVARGTDVHGRAQADGREAFEHRNIFAGIASAGGRRSGRSGHGGEVFRH